MRSLPKSTRYRHNYKHECAVICSCDIKYYCYIVFDLTEFLESPVGYMCCHVEVESIVHSKLPTDLLQFGRRHKQSIYRNKECNGHFKYCWQVHTLLSFAGQGQFQLDTNSQLHPLAISRNENAILCRLPLRTHLAFQSTSDMGSLTAITGVQSSYIIMV